MILLVASTKDIASINIKKKILENYEFEESTRAFHSHPIYQGSFNQKEVEFITINEEPIHSQTIMDCLIAELVIYVSRHSSKRGTPTLSVHTPGNLADAEKGGIPRKLSIAPAGAMKEALLELTRQKETLNLEFQISYECTHHGPSLDTPTMFVELGSSPEQWSDMQAAAAVARAAMAPILNESRLTRVAVGIGGPHYNQKFTKLALTSSLAFGHMVPKYAISNVDTEILSQCVERSSSKVEAIIIDWKGIKGVDRPMLAMALQNVDVPVERT